MAIPIAQVHSVVTRVGLIESRRSSLHDEWGRNSIINALGKIAPGGAIGLQQTRSKRGTSLERGNMRKLILCSLLVLAGTAAASAQRVITTNIERDNQGRVSTITSTSPNGTTRTEFTHTPTSTQAKTTYQRNQAPGYNPLGQGGYRPLGR
jgi:hypothetical protein